MAKVHKRKRNGNSSKNTKNKGISRFIKTFAILLLIAGTLVLLAMSPAFNIKKISVSGSSIYGMDEIIGVSGVVKGENGFGKLGPGLEAILSLRYEYSEDNIRNSLPYIKDAVVKYIVPDTIRISLLERQGFCFVQYFGMYVLVDRDGYAIDSEQTPAGYPIIKGLDIKGLEIGHAMVMDDSSGFERIASLIDALAESDKETSTDILGAVNYFEAFGKETHLLLDSRIMVKIDDRYENIYTIELLREIILKNIREDERGILDFTQGSNPIFIPED